MRGYISRPATRYTSYEEALSTARAEKKKILADFTGSDWCGWCIKLHDEVFATKEFKEWAAKKVVLLELDFPRKKEQTAELKKQNQELQKKFAIEGYPTIVFLDADGKELGRSGYLEGGPGVWTKRADEIIDKK
ncbi:MAG: thioredoxin family protein [Planctomycetota bacterium]